jgi:hypothetical protein
MRGNSSAGIFLLLVLLGSLLCHGRAEEAQEDSCNGAQVCNMFLCKILFTVPASSLNILGMKG